MQIFINTNDTTTIQKQSYIYFQTIDNKILLINIPNENALDISDGFLTIPSIVQDNELNCENMIVKPKSSPKFIIVPITDSDINLLQNGIKTIKIGKDNKTIFEYKYEDTVGKKIANYIYSINEIVNK